MSSNEKDETEIKVNDKRRFDSEGNARDVAKEEFQLVGEAVAKGAPEGSVPQVDFSAFVMSLATQSLIQLGEAKPPPGMNIPVDVAAAKQTIDILCMLEDKTRGNLDPQEAKLFEEILHQLRLSYLRKAKK